MGVSLIDITEMSKVYGSGAIAVHALRGVDAAVEAGEFVAIMGPSGSGKSTLMNILGCLDRPTGGVYVLDGEDVSKLSKNRLAGVRNRKIGFVFQSYNLLPRISAAKNVLLPLMYDGVNPLSDRECHERAVAALERVGLGDRTHHKPNEMSGGQQQRVAIARALINTPSIILADEPTGNLDTASARRVLELFGELHERGRTVVLVTHDPRVADVAHRTIVVEDGRVSESGALTSFVGMVKPAGGKEER